MKEAHTALRTCCGLTVNETEQLTELVLSDRHLGAGGAILLASDIQDMKALTLLDISLNQICDIEFDGFEGEGTFESAGITALSNVIGSLTELNISNNELTFEGATILATSIDGNNAMVCLDISASKLELDGARAMAEALGRTT